MSVTNSSLLKLTLLGNGGVGKVFNAYEFNSI